MTHDELKSALVHQAKLIGVADGIDIQDLAESAIDIGLKEFWKAREWSFRKRPYTLAISSEVETYDLPADFGGMIAVREKSSLVGRSLMYEVYEEFVARFPYPDANPSGYPSIYTVYRDRSDSHTWKIRFYPVPESGMSLYLDYLSDTITDVSEVPDSCAPGLMEVCIKYLLPPGSQARWSQENQVAKLLDRLWREDGAFHGALFRFHDDTDIAVGRFRPWVQE